MIKEEERIYYVTMTDYSTSGRGESKGKINKLIFVCQRYEEAKIVEDNAHERAEMQFINICTKKPYYNRKYYYPQYKTREGYGAWYIKNCFRDRNRIEKRRLWSLVYKELFPG